MLEREDADCIEEEREAETRDSSLSVHVADDAADLLVASIKKKIESLPVTVSKQLAKRSLIIG